MTGEHAPFGRPRDTELPEKGLVRFQIRVPARLARMVYAQASAEHRHLTSIVTEALDAHYLAHPPESWSTID
ncbi:hypothetical protein [Corynebacterium glyciniphilum]|uniref:hypothetical protein n=1 Tax=Corynebacterium glyciniphilum TaxID=1404244 RepID=UPI003D9FBFD3